MLVFDIPEQEKAKFLGFLTDYYKFIHQKGQEEATKLASYGLDNLLQGLDLNGYELPEKYKFFDEVVAYATENLYTPKPSERLRFKRAPKKAGRKPKETKESLIRTSDLAEQERFGTIKKNLLYEYPFLNRIDLEDAVNNYCLLMVRINNLLETGSDINNLAIKNLTETQIKLGQYLGISESDRQKMKQAGDKDSVASLSLQFQQTIDEMPEIVDRFKYQELRILLHKFERGEITRELFELEAFAGMTLEQAVEFVKEREDKY